MLFPTEMRTMHESDRARADFCIVAGRKLLIDEKALGR
jgi:hypothetical protein